MATTAKTGFDVACPFCGQTEPTITLGLNNLQTLHCHDCDEEFTATEALAKAEENAANWRRVKAWIEGAQGFMGE